MFFELTNSPAIFQTIMNKILWDLINTREVVSFINDVIVGIEKTKEHDGVVEEVVKRLAENNLYVKLEKYKQKIREVGFLGVVIKPEVMKIEKKKIKIVLDWQSPMELRMFRNSQNLPIIIGSLSKILHLQLDYYIIW